MDDRTKTIAIVVATVIAVAVALFVVGRSFTGGSTINQAEVSGEVSKAATSGTGAVAPQSGEVAPPANAMLPGRKGR